MWYSCTHAHYCTPRGVLLEHSILYNIYICVYVGYDQFVKYSLGSQRAIPHTCMRFINIWFQRYMIGLMNVVLHSFKCFYMHVYSIWKRNPK